ncbi:MAG: tetratricopeptide repeat protein [Ignavibacteria bacterium]|nr:tetratricopeptide repeat protein [Ignavibacteria bacterium]
MRLFFVPVSLVVVIILSSVASSQEPIRTPKFKLAESYEKAGKFEEAVRLYEELYEGQPGNHVYFEGLRRVYLKLKRYNDAISLLQKRVTTSPGDVNLRGMLGSVYYKAGVEKEATAAWESALATDPTNPSYYRLIANILLENRLLDRTAELYRRARVACGDPNLFTTDLAHLLAVTMDYDGATTEYIRWLNQNPTQLGFVQSRMSRFTGKMEGLSAALATVRGELEKHEDVSLYELMGWLYLEGKQFHEAFEIYKKIDKMSRKNGARIHAFADRVFKEGTFEVAAKAYFEAINTPVATERLPQAKFGYASALKELSILADTLQGSLSIDEFPATESQPQYAGAIAYFRQIISEYPHSDFSAKSYYQMGTIQFERFFDLDGSLRSFEQVEQELPGVNVLSHDVSLKMGEIFTAKGDTAKAAARFRTVMNNPAAVPDQRDEASYRLAELEYFNGRFQGAIQLLEGITLNLKADYANDALLLLSFLQENTMTSEPALAQFARAHYLARQRKNTEAIAIFLKVIDQYPQALLVDDALMKVGTLQAEAQLNTDAIATYERLLEEFTESSIALDKAQFSIGEIYHYKLNDKAKAISAYDKLLADFPQSILTAEARKRIRRLRGDTL